MQAKDAVGNLSAATSYTWSIVPPAPTITAKPANPTNITSASFSFTDALAGVSFQCSLDNVAFAVCTSPKSYPGPLAPGSHNFRVKALSGANESAISSYTWTVDTTAPPTPTITAKPASLSNTTSPSFSFTDSEAGVSFLCKLDAGAYVACTSPTSYVGLAQGAHSFSVQAKDAAGNIGGAAAWSWTIDSVPPPAPMITDKPDDPNGDGLADFTWITDAGVAYYRCMIENEGFLPCDSPYRKILNIANSGQHQFAVRAYDAGRELQRDLLHLEGRHRAALHDRRQRGRASLPGRADEDDRPGPAQPEQLPDPGRSALRSRWRARAPVRPPISS